MLSSQEKYQCPGSGQDRLRKPLDPNISEFVRFVADRGPLLKTYAVDAPCVSRNEQHTNHANPSIPAILLSTILRVFSSLLCIERYRRKICRVFVVGLSRLRFFARRIFGHRHCKIASRLLREIPEICFGENTTPDYQ
jgi:hypothetical protein